MEQKEKEWSKKFDKKFYKESGTICSLNIIFKERMA